MRFCCFRCFSDLLLYDAAAMALGRGRVRVVPVENLAEELPEGWCRGPRAGDLGVEGECGLVPLLEGCAPAS